MPGTDGAAANSAASELCALDTADAAVQRFTQLADTLDATAVIGALGCITSSEAARTLGWLADAASDKNLRKAARRELHRLRSVGIQTAPAAPPAAAPRRGVPASTLVRSLVSRLDGDGAREIWLVWERVLGGLDLLMLLVHEQRGVRDAAVRDTTRRRLTELVQQTGEQLGAAFAEVPVEYGLALLAEALARNRESGQVVPAPLQARRDLLASLPAPAEPLIYQHVARGQIMLRPDLLDRAETLLEEPELDGWMFDWTDVRPTAEKIAERRLTSNVAINPITHEELDSLLDDAVRVLATTDHRKRLSRRLEETALLLWLRGAERQARVAVALAQELTGMTITTPRTSTLVIPGAAAAASVETTRPAWRFLRQMVNLGVGAAIALMEEAGARGVDPDRLVEALQRGSPGEV
ncbi:MAG: hypothetical protein U0821_10925 [Chloroflexota bacterium]